MTEVEQGVDTRDEWRLLLKYWKDSASQEQIDALLEEVGPTTRSANQRTLNRWIKGPDKPDSRRKVLMLEKHIPEMSAALRKAFPHYYEVAQDVILRSVAPFYARVHRARARTEKSFMLRTITRLVLSNMVDQLDPEQHGFIAILGQLQKAERPDEGQEDVVPENAGKAERLILHAWSAYGTGVWFEYPIQHSFTAAPTSLCALAAKTGEEAFYPRDRDQLYCSPLVVHVGRMESAAAYPVLRSGRIAGIIFLASVQPKFFDSKRKAIIEHYAMMQHEAFEDNDFYAMSDIELKIDERDAYKQFLVYLALEYPDETQEQLEARAVMMFREYCQKGEQQ
ncbi:MAG TPA: GAF domain-containing protein [Dictyobacter sp.]|nr:GAF domain-containing protein [Dictyobacter sp.]